MDKKIKLVIFDLDGTLVNAYAAVAQSINNMLGKLGYPAASENKIKRSVGWGEVHLISQFVKPKDLARAVAIYRRHHPAALKRGTKLLPGAKEILRYLKGKGYGIAVASNRATTFTKIIVRQLEIADYFDFILCRDKVKRPKPFPDILNGILGKFFLKPSQAIFVGDMVVDVQAGHSARIRPLAVVTGSCTRREIVASRPFKVIRRLEALKKVLAAIEKE